MTKQVRGVTHPTTLWRLLPIAAVLLVFALVLVTPAAAEETSTDNWIDVANIDWYKDGETTFTITTAEQLAGLVKLTTEGNTFTGKKITLGGNIDLAGADWSGGAYGKSFSGEFDGANYIISNLANASSEDHKGLFAHVNEAYIHDLTFENVVFTGVCEGSLYAGALAGELESKNVIKNVHVNGIKYDITSNGGSIGSIGGYSYDSNYIGCTVNAPEFNVTSTSSVNMGGFVGQGRGVGTFSTAYDNTCTYSYENCEVNNPVFNVNGKSAVGGFLGVDGYNHWANYGKNCNVTNLKVTCAADYAQYTVGGFMASNYGANYGKDYAFENCHTIGTITSLGTNTDSVFGGFVGWVGGRPTTLKDCTADVTITVGAGDVGGFAGETQQYFAHAYQFDSCVANGDVSTESGTAGAFVGSLQHGGDGTGLNVEITNSAANGAVTGTTAGSFVGSVTDEKNDVLTGGSVVIEGSTATTATVTGAQSNVDSTIKVSGTTVTYEITWKNDDGTVLKKTQAEQDTLPVPSVTPTKVADATYEYTFSGWDPAITAANKTTEYTATYSKSLRSYTITTVADENSTISVVENARVGDKVIVTGIPETGYTVASISVTKSGEEDTVVASTTNGAAASFVMPAYDVNVTATFAEASDDASATICTLTLINAENGTIIAIPSGTVRVGETVTLSATIEEGYTFSKFTVTNISGTSEITTNPGTFEVSDAAGDITVTLVTTKNEYRVTKDASVVNGEFDVSKTTANVNDVITITATADEGYAVEKISVWSETYGDITVAEDNSFVMPAGDVTVKVTFNLPTATISDGGQAIFSATFTEYSVSTVTFPSGYSGTATFISTTSATPTVGDVTHATFEISVNPALTAGNAIISFSVPLDKIPSGFEADEGYLAHFGTTGWEKLPTTYTVSGTDVNYEATTTGFSPFAIVFEAGTSAGGTTQQTSNPSGSSSGSSVWLTEPVNPTDAPTQQPTDKPTDTVPTDIPSTQPTATPSTPGFGVLAVLAGLGAVVALRRQ